MKKFVRKLFWIIAIFGILYGIFLSVDYRREIPYSLQETEGWVIDKETKQPLEGVIVLIEWEIMTHNFVETTGSAPFVVEETVTDQNGHFFFPKWETIKIKGSLDSYTPYLTFIKEDYLFLVRSNSPSSKRDSSTLTSDLNRETIAMEKFKGTQTEHAKQTADFSDNIRHIVNRGCLWTHIPKTVEKLFSIKQKNLSSWKENISPQMYHFYTEGIIDAEWFKKNVLSKEYQTGSCRSNPHIIFKTISKENLS
jgi:hypothetical protein